MDYIGATPQANPLLGLLAERLKQAQEFAAKPFGYSNPPAEMLMNLLGVPAVQQTAERLAYGEPLTTGRGMTTQIRPEAVEAALTVAPVAGLLGKGTERAAMAAGRAGERYAEKVVPQIMERGGLPAQLLGDLSQGSVRPVVLMHGGKAPITTIDPEKLIQSVQSSGFHTTNKAYTPFSFATNQNKSEGVVSAFDFPDELYARTLNYDKPISQSPYVMDAISNLVEKDESLRQKMIGEVKNLYKAAKESGEDINAQDVMTGKQFHSLLRRHYGGLKEADAALENVGITGASWQYSAKRPDEIATAIYPKYAEQLKAIGQYQASPDDLQGMTKNINKDIGLLGQSKAAFTYPQEEAIRLAQQRAALPISEGGLGLKPNNTAAERAAAMGFDIDLLHGTAKDFNKFDMEMAGTNTRQAGDELGFFATAKPFLADSYAEIASKGGWANRTQPGGAVVYPLKANLQSPKKFETASNFYREADPRAAQQSLGKWRDELQNQGFDSVIVRPDMEEVVAFNPDQLRSRFAAFDPWRKTSAIAAAMGVAAPDLLAEEQKPKKKKSLLD